MQSAEFLRICHSSKDNFLQESRRNGTIHAGRRSLPPTAHRELTLRWVLAGRVLEDGSLKLRFGEVPNADDTKVLIVPSITDIRGNGAALNKLMSTRFPSSAVLMELASRVKARG